MDEIVKIMARGLIALPSEALRRMIDEASRRFSP
jgi:hypothetical protein